MSFTDYQFIIDQVNEYDSSIYSFYVKTVLLKSEKSEDNEKLIFGIIEPINNKELKEYKVEILDYPEIKYISKIISKEKLVEILTVFGASATRSHGVETIPAKYKISSSMDKILDSDNVVIPIKEELQINLKGFSKNDRVEYHEYDTTLSSRHTDSHTSYYALNFGSSNIRLNQITNLYTDEYPYYPDADDLILEKFAIDLKRFTALVGQLQLKIPQKFKGEIVKIDYIDEKIEYHVKLDIVKKAILKIYIKDRYKNLGKSYTVQIKKKATKDTLPVPFEPNWVDALLLDETQKIIHKTRISKEFYDELSRKPKAIEKKILQGEGITIDFKLTLPSNDKLIKLICSFANTDGGEVLLGVKDNADIIGLTYPVNRTLVNFDAVEVHIQNIIDSNIDPPIKIEGFPVTLKDIHNNDCEIGVIRVKESNIVVKNLRDNEYYIRRGSTNRKARSVEIKELYQKKLTSSYI